MGTTHSGACKSLKKTSSNDEDKVEFPDQTRNSLSRRNSRHHKIFYLITSDSNWQYNVVFAIHFLSSPILYTAELVAKDKQTT